MGDKGKIYYHFGPSTSNESRSTVKATLSDVYNKANKNKYFFYDLNIHLVDKISDLQDSSLFLSDYKQEGRGYTAGITISPLLNDNKKDIVVYSSKNWKHDISYIWQKEFSEDELKQHLLHELGHQFDFYFYNCPEELSKKVRNLTDDTPDDEWNKVIQEYSLNDGLNDTKEFKEAWKKDVEALGKQNFFERKSYQSKLGYINPTLGNDIDITDGIDENEIKLADNARAECFAQLFSVALGGEGSINVNAIKYIYKNTFNVVKNYIKQYLGIEVV